MLSSGKRNPQVPWYYEVLYYDRNWSILFVSNDTLFVSRSERNVCLKTGNDQVALCQVQERIDKMLTRS